MNSGVTKLPGLSPEKINQTDVTVHRRKPKTLESRMRFNATAISAVVQSTKQSPEETMLEAKKSNEKKKKFLLAAAGFLGVAFIAGILYFFFAKYGDEPEEEDKKFLKNAAVYTGTKLADLTLEFIKKKEE